MGRYVRTLVTVVAFLTLLTPIRAHEDSPTFDGADFEPSKPGVERTYDFPEISTGFNYDFETNRTRPVLTAEIRDPLTQTFGVPTKLDAGVGEDLVLATWNLRLTSIVEVSVGVSYGYDFDEQETTPGLNVLVTEF